MYKDFEDFNLQDGLREWKGPLPCMVKNCEVKRKVRWFIDLISRYYLSCYTIRLAEELIIQAVVDWKR